MKGGRWAGLRDGSVLKGWFFSYLLVLAVPLLLCLLLYDQAYQTIRSESERMYNSTLEQVRIDIDAYLNEVQQAQQQLLLDNAIQEATHIGEVAQPADQLTTVDVRDELQHLLMSHSNLESAALVLNRSGSVVTPMGYMSLATYYGVYFDDSSGLPLADFQEYLRQPHISWDMLCLPGSNGRQYLIFCRTTLTTTLGRPSGTVVVTVDQSLLQKRLQQFSWDPRLSLFIVAPDSTLVCQTEDTAPLELDLASLTPSTAMKTVQSNGQSCGMLVQESAVSGWQYVLLAEDGLLRQSARRIQLYTYFGLMICMLLGLLLSHLLTQRNYHPLHEILDRFSDQKDAAPLSGGNEYKQLDRYIEEFFARRGDEQHTLWNSQQALHKYELYTLLEHPRAGGWATPEGAVQLPQAEAYLVVLFSPPLDDDQSSADLVRFAVMNIFEEVAGAHFPLEMTVAGENAAAIVALPSVQTGLPGALEEDIRFTQQQIQEHFHLAVGAAAGDPHPDISGIHYSYREALEAVSYQHAGRETDLVAYRDIRDTRSSYTLPLEEERKLIDLIAAGKNAEARQVLDEVFANNLQQGVQSDSVARCLAYDMMSALVKGANLAGVNGLSVVRFVEIEHCPTAELPAKLGELVDLLCEKVRTNAPIATPSSQLCEEVCAYIQQNFRDPDLNISQTGLHFDLTPAYLSALFKRETGSTLLSYITQVRLDAAKELLLRGQPVARIAEQCGFRDSGTLIRVFKKSTGLTPGQYRTIHGGGGQAPAAKETS